MVGLKEKEKENSSKNHAQLVEYHKENQRKCVEIMTKASQSPKVVYKSTNDPKRFVKYLETRLDKWETLSSEGSIYGKKMLNKTNEIINNLSVQC